MAKEDHKPQRPASSGVVTRAMRGERLYSQDLFKLKVASDKYNVGFLKYRPTLIEREHCHFWRNVKDNGEENQYSQAIGGHFHEVKVEWHPDGTLKSAKCGPALHKTQVILPGSKRKVSRIMPVSYEKEDDRGVSEIVDDHTHEMVYIHTDEISPQKRESMRMSESAKVKTLMGDQAIKNYTTPTKPNPQTGNIVVEE